MMQFMEISMSARTISLTKEIEHNNLKGTFHEEMGQRAWLLLVSTKNKEFVRKLENYMTSKRNRLWL